VKTGSHSNQTHHNNHKAHKVLSSQYPVVTMPILNVVDILKLHIIS